MFQILDKDNGVINLKDKVLYETIQDDLFEEGEKTEQVGIVIALLEGGFVQVQPEKGPPLEVLGSHTKVIDSLIRDIEALATDEELLKILQSAEARYEEACKGGKKSSSSTPKKGSSKDIVGTLDLEL